MPNIETVIAVLGGLTGIASLYFTWDQWKKINKKIGMLSDASKAAEVLPAWYTSRMMQDDWLFGLITSYGQLIAIKSIVAISDDGKWMDVELAESNDVDAVRDKFPFQIIHAVAADRTRASLQIQHVVAALDLQTS